MCSTTLWGHPLIREMKEGGSCLWRLSVSFQIVTLFQTHCQALIGSCSEFMHIVVCGYSRVRVNCVAVLVAGGMRTPEDAPATPLCLTLR